MILVEQDFKFDMSTIPSDFDVCEIIDKKFLSEKITEVMATLTPMEARVLYLRIWEERSLRDIGKEFNLCGQSILLTEARALRKLRHPTRCNRLRAFRKLFNDRYITSQNLILFKKGIERDQRKTESRYIKYVSKREIAEFKLKIKFDGRLPNEQERRFDLPIRSYQGTCKCRTHLAEHYISKNREIKVRCSYCHDIFTLKWDMQKTEKWRVSGYSTEGGVGAIYVVREGDC